MKMSQGTLLLSGGCTSYVPEAIVKHYKLDVELKTADSDNKFANAFPLNDGPAFIGAKGEKVQGVLAVSYYLINLIEEEKVRNALLGASNEERSHVLMWVSLANSDLLNNVATQVTSFKGEIPFNKKACDTAADLVSKIVGVYERRLRDCTYLASEKVSLADLVSAAVFTFAFTTILGNKWRSDHGIIMRWFNTVAATPYFSEKFASVKFAEEPLKFNPPKKEKKEKPKEEQPKKEQKKQAAKEEDVPAEPKKPKHPLEALGRPTFDLEEWKRKYSNEDTRPVALPWFWERYNPGEYSIWRVDYKYNDELTLTFMSNNLVGGFFNRLSASTKYMFGCLVVYGENNANGIVGAIMVRGQEFEPAFNVAPDWESYNYKKLDVTNDDDKEFINNMWAWDKPVVVDGVSKDIADGKVLK